MQSIIKTVKILALVLIMKREILIKAIFPRIFSVLSALLNVCIQTHKRNMTTQTQMHGESNSSSSSSSSYYESILKNTVFSFACQKNLSRPLIDDNSRQNACFHSGPHSIRSIISSFCQHIYASSENNQNTTQQIQYTYLDAYTFEALINPIDKTKYSHQQHLFTLDGKLYKD